MKHFAPEAGEGAPMGQLCLQSLGVLVPAGEGEKWLSIGRFLGEKLFPQPSHLPGAWCLAYRPLSSTAVLHMRPSHAGMTMTWGLMLLQYLVSSPGQQHRSQAPLYWCPPCTRRPAQPWGGPGAACSGAELCIRGSCQEGRWVFAPTQGCVKAKKGRRRSSVPCTTLVCFFCLEQISQEVIPVIRLEWEAGKEQERKG